MNLSEHKVDNVNYGITHVPSDHHFIEVIEYFEIGKIYTWVLKEDQSNSGKLGHYLTKVEGGERFPTEHGSKFLCYDKGIIKIREDFHTKQQVYLLGVSFIAPNSQAVRDFFHSDTYSPPGFGLKKLKSKWRKISSEFGDGT